MMKEQMKPRNIWLDFFKIFLCWLVVCIHFAGKEYAHFGVYRMAVPMFFMISGYFVYHKEQEKRTEKAKIFIKRSTVYMLMGLAFYFVFDFLLCLRDKTNPSDLFVGLYVGDFIRNFLLRNQNPLPNAYHLWFIIALFVVSILHFLIVKFKKEKWYYIIIPITLAVHFFFNGYVKNYGGTVVSLSYTRNGLFFGLPTFGIGYCLAKFNFHKKKWLKYIYLAAGLFFFWRQIAESKALAREVYISSVLCAVFLLLFFVGLKKRKCNFYYNWFGKSMPFYVYILHLGVGVRLEKYLALKNIVIKDVYMKCLFIFLISFVLYEIIFLLIKLLKWLYARLTHCIQEKISQREEKKNLKNKEVEPVSTELENQQKEQQTETELT